MDFSSFIAVLSLTVSGFMVGNEIAVGLFVHPQLWQLSKENHINFVQPFAKGNGKIMPFWYLITLLTSALLTYILSNNENLSGFWLGLIACVLWLLSIIYTIVALVPINNKVATWNRENLPEDWEQQMHTWDRRVRCSKKAFSYRILKTGVKNLRNL